MTDEESAVDNNINSTDKNDKNINNNINMKSLKQSINAISDTSSSSTGSSKSISNVNHDMINEKNSIDFTEPDTDQDGQPSSSTTTDPDRQVKTATRPPMRSVWQRFISLQRKKSVTCIKSFVCYNATVDLFYDFCYSGCAGVMVSYSFLYFTVLSFGSLMTVYLLWAGMSEYWIGISRGISSLTGFLGAFSYPWVKNKIGAWQAGQVAITYQFTLVFLAASSFAWADRHTSAVVTVVCVLLSRVGLWMFDLVARQLAQENIQESVRGKVNGQWR